MKRIFKLLAVVASLSMLGGAMAGKGDMQYAYAASVPVPPISALGK